MARAKFAYKLLPQDMISHNNTLWVIGETQEKEDKTNNIMCSNNVFHCYSHPVLAILLNPMHARIFNPRLFKIKVDAICNDDGFKQASFSQTLTKELQVPEITLNQKIAFAIYCTLSAYKDKQFKVWAYNWLSGKDRTYKSATHAIHAAHTAATAAYNAATAATAAAATATAATAAHTAATAAATIAKRAFLLKAWNKAKHIN